MTTHTPGPWEIEADGPSFLIREEDDLIIAGTYGFGAPDRDGEERANAALIAAAPELLAALQAFLDAENLIDDEYYAAIDAAETQARAAIAKATGEVS